MKKFFLQFYYDFLREFRLIKGDMGILIFFLLLPLAYPIVYSLIYNPELVREVGVVVVDNDRSSLSRELVRRLDATQGTWIKGYAADLPEARRAMNENQVYGILEIPEGFAKKAGLGEQAEAVIYCEMSLMLRYKALLVSATDVMQDLGATLTTERIDRIAPLAETVAVGDLMPVSNIAMGNIESGFDSFVMPGILVLILQQSMMLAIGMCGGARREKPWMTELRPDMENNSVIASMLSRTLVYLILIAVPTIYVLHYVPMMFKFPMSGDLFSKFIFILPMLFASAGLGFILQGIVRERESVFVIWVVTSLIFLFLSGLTWPQYAIHGFWRVLSDAVPATWGVQGFIKMNTNGASLAQVATPYTNLWILTLIYYVIGYFVQRFIEKPAVIRAYKAFSGKR